MSAPSALPTPATPSLADTQRRLQALLLDAAPPDAGDLLDAGSARGLAVYRHAYRARLVAALRDNYAVLVQVMGDEDFDALAAAYVQAKPSPHASIRWYGEQLADFLADRLAGHDAVAHPAFVDIARMDWTLRAVFDAADEPALAFESLQRLAPQDWARLRLRPRASSRLLPLDWAVAPAWAALARRAARAPGDDGDEALALPAPEPLVHALLAWRPQLETRWRSLAPGEGALVAAVFAGVDWPGLGEIAVTHWGEDEAPARLVACLQQWVAEGWLRASD
ncbi:DNA-binding domain-containing protein [Pelomonas sp. APW6]|uniref:DNA-binding domain-containing protein n=1 Tax=Roseateles subflavus TaxID=3053353 RepID=A0ABT7LE60_9BURK|nr:DNA-binding domain-containing protein [Pelomonas sp. APW6]MDL5030567.1 DNA-binding domain-containing protein [Pelomonas sp. APW6]